MWAILDKKSGKVAPWTALQLAAYEILDTSDGVLFDGDLFDPSNHSYFLNGVRLPSVTQVLQAEGFIDTRFFEEWDRERGRIVHLATHYDDLGELDEDSLDPVIIPYVEAWRKFKRESGFVVEQSETPRASKMYGFAGTTDTIGRFPKGALKRAAVELHNDGTYKLYPFTDRNDVNVWLAALAVFNWKRNNLRRKS